MRTTPNINEELGRLALREKRSRSELFWSAFSHIWTEYREIQSASPNSIQMRENMDKSNSQYGQFLRSVDDAINSKFTPYFTGRSIEKMFNNFYITSN